MEATSEYENDTLLNDMSAIEECCIDHADINQKYTLTKRDLLQKLRKKYGKDNSYMAHGLINIIKARFKRQSKASNKKSR